jgi:hypothetical protein
LTLLIVMEGWSASPTFEAPLPPAAGVIPEGAVVLDLPIAGDYRGRRPAVPRGRRQVPHHQRLQRLLPPFVEPFIKEIGKRSDEVLRGYLRAADLYVIIRPDADPALAEWIASFPGASKRPAAGEARVYRLPRRLAARNR